MKTPLKLIIAAFAILTSFAFASVNYSLNKTEKQATVSQTQQPMSGFALEDQNQWDN